MTIFIHEKLQLSLYFRKGVLCLEDLGIKMFDNSLNLKEPKRMNKNSGADFLYVACQEIYCISLLHSFLWIAVNRETWFLQAFARRCERAKLWSVYSHTYAFSSIPKTLISHCLIKTRHTVNQTVRNTWCLQSDSNSVVPNCVML